MRKQKLSLMFATLTSSFFCHSWSFSLLLDVNGPLQWNLYTKTTDSNETKLEQPLNYNISFFVSYPDYKQALNIMKNPIQFSLYDTSCCLYMWKPVCTQLIMEWSMQGSHITGIGCGMRSFSVVSACEAIILKRRFVCKEAMKLNIETNTCVYESATVK